MLGKRFRRTTSMSHLGPASPIVDPLPAAEGSPGKSPGAPHHSVPHKAARPSIFQAHIISEYGAFKEEADHVRPGGADVNITAGCALPSQKQKPCPESEGSCAVDQVVCNDLDMEGSMAPLGCDEMMVCCGDASAVAGLSDFMMEGNHMGLVEANEGMMKGRYCQEQAPASIRAYQMGLWIRDSMNGSEKLLEMEKEASMLPVGFLDVCFHCKRRLRHERDIYIYRGDTAFCSEECRYRQIVKDERRASRASSSSSSSKRAGGGARRGRSSTETAVAA